MRAYVAPGRVAQSNRGEIKARPQSSQPILYPAPKGGLITALDIASEQPGSAAILQNFTPTIGGAKIRGGSFRKALTADGLDITTLFKYKYGGSEKLFATTASAIYDVTSPAAPPTTTAADVSSLNGGDWVTFQHTNTGVSYLVAVNGADARHLYSPSGGWVTSPSITFTDGTTESQLHFGWTYKNREFFLKKDTLDAYYLAVNAISGAATLFPLGGVLKKGGALLMGFGWSIESGDGIATYCVFISTEGEVAVYSGDDPSSASTFGLVGTYQIGKPLGKLAFAHVGGDILIATTDGLVPMSQVLARGQLTLQSVSRAIEDDWKNTATATAQTGWALKLWPEQNLILVSFPDNPAFPGTVFVLNVLTGKWSHWTGWIARCFETLSGLLHFGSDAGYVWRGDTGGADDGLAFTAVYLSQFLAAQQQFGHRANATLARMFLRSSTAPNVKLFARADYDVDIPAPSSASSGTEATAGWDISLWDVGLWDDGVLAPSTSRLTYRQNVRASGDLIAVGCVIASSGTAKLDVEIDLATVQIATGEASA